MTHIIWVICVLYDKIHILTQIITSRDCCYGKLQLQSGDGYIRVPNEYISIQRLSENHQTLNYARLPTIDLSDPFCSINIPGTNSKLILRDVYMGLIWWRLTILHHSDAVYVQRSCWGPRGAVWPVSIKSPWAPLYWTNRSLVLIPNKINSNMKNCTLVPHQQLI